MVERICSRIVIIDRGQQIITGTAERIVSDTDASTLEEAFSKLTGVRTAEDLSDDVISARIACDGRAPALMDRRGFPAVHRPVASFVDVDFRTGMIARGKQRRKEEEGLPGLWQLALFYAFSVRIEFRDH